MIVEIYNALEAEPESGEYLSRLVDAVDAPALATIRNGWELASFPVIPANTPTRRRRGKPKPRWTWNDEWLWFAERFQWNGIRWAREGTAVAKRFRVDHNDAIVGLDVAGLSLHDYHILVAMVRVAVDRLREKGWRL